MQLALAPLLSLVCGALVQDAGVLSFGCFFPSAHIQNGLVVCAL